MSCVGSIKLLCRGIRARTKGRMRIAGGESCLAMNDDQQGAGLDVGQENVMERVLRTFDSLYDDTTSFISSAAANIGARVGDVTRDLGQDLGDTSMGDIGEDISRNADDVATSLGETATRVGAVVVDKLNAAMTFAAGLFGG